MWIIADFGFFSVVEKPGDAEAGVLTVRARQRGDLEALRSRYLPTMTAIRESKDTDYRFRAKAPRGAVASALALAAENISYDNFKQRAHDMQGEKRAMVYSRVWRDLLELQRP